MFLVFQKETPIDGMLQKEALCAVQSLMGDLQQ